MGQSKGAAPYWPNHYADAIPVPIEALAEACAASLRARGSHPDHDAHATAAGILAHWRSQHRGPLDAYVLPDPVTFPRALASVGVRYGAGASQYLSPYCHREEAARLIASPCFHARDMDGTCHNCGTSVPE